VQYFTNFRYQKIKFLQKKIYFAAVCFCVFMFVCLCVERGGYKLRMPNFFYGKGPHHHCMLFRWRHVEN